MLGYNDPVQIKNVKANEFRKSAVPFIQFW